MTRLTSHHNSIHRDGALQELARPARLRPSGPAAVLAHPTRLDLQLRVRGRDRLCVRLPLERVVLCWEHHHRLEYVGRSLSCRSAGLICMLLQCL